MVNQYETVFILTPVLSEDQVKETVKTYEKLITGNGGEIVNRENWGMRKLAYPIQKKSTGFYNLFEYRVDGQFIEKLEVQYKRDEKVLRFLTVKLDKHAIAYSEKRRKKFADSKKVKTAEKKA
ncbi:MAG: 30S ribosomal protein S6 [bacterium]|nr:MAG: 30S ribosomal protein S6 [bacterium]